MPSVKLSSTYDGFSSGNVIETTLHEARVLVQAGTASLATPADIANDGGNGKRQRKSH